MLPELFSICQVLLKTAAITVCREVVVDGRRRRHIGPTPAANYPLSYFVSRLR